MSGSSDTLRFRFPTHGDSILSKIKALREDCRFCDITLLLGGHRGTTTTVQPVHFHGHRVVLAASSDFLRDQFLLHEDRAELSVHVVSSVEVGKRLLLSCYTGLLEVPLRELVSYLTAASALQMTQVVEKCAQAISQYLRPTLAFLTQESHSDEKELQQPDGDLPGNNQQERDAAQPSTSVQEARSEDEGAGVSQLRVDQGAEVDGQGLKEVRGDDCLDTLESEEGGDIRPGHTNKVSHPVRPIKGSLRFNLHLPAAVKDQSQNQEEEVEEEQGEQEEILLLELQDYRKLVDSNLFHLPESPSSGYDLTKDPDGVSIQRPYLCRRCDRVFQHLESYVGHLKEHRQYLCLVCGKGFAQRSTLTRHIRVHTGVKPFRCPLCHKTFSQKATLQDHLNLHTGDKPHKCKYCAEHFAHKPGLRRHLKDTHGKSGLQNVLGEAVH